MGKHLRESMGKHLRDVEGLSAPSAGQTIDGLASARFGGVFSEMLPCDIVKLEDDFLSYAEEAKELD